MRFRLRSANHRSLLPLAGALCMLAACSPSGAGSPPVAPAASPAPSLPASPAASSAVSPSPVAPAVVPSSPSAVPTLAASPSAAPTAAVAVAASPAAAVASVSPAASAAAGAIRLVLTPNGSEARFRAREQLLQRSLPNDVVGSTRAVTGAITLAPSGAILPDQSRVTVDVATLQTDTAQRDNFIKRNTLETARFPTAEFVPRQATGLPSPLPTSGEAEFQLQGDLTVHGVTRPATWNVTVQFTPEEVSGTATTPVTLPDFGMQKPIVGPVLSIEDTLTLEIDFQARRSGT